MPSPSELIPSFNSEVRGGFATNNGKLFSPGPPGKRLKAACTQDNRRAFMGLSVESRGLGVELKTVRQYPGSAGAPKERNPVLNSGNSDNRLAVMANESSAAAFRLFVAIALPEPVRNEIIRMQQELQPLVPCTVARWTRPDQFHLTLRFLGAVPVDSIETLKHSVGAVCRNARPLSLRAEGVGFFPNPRSPRVVWVGINDGEGWLVGLQQQIEAAVRPFSPEPGEKNFTGHVTLGRLKNPRPSDARNLAAHVQSLAKQAFGDWTAGQIEIIRSELSPNGARYTLLAVFRLGAENV